MHSLNLGVQPGVEKFFIASNPIPTLPGLAFQPVEQQIEFLGTDRAGGPLAGRPTESPTLQPFRANPQPRTVPEKDFEPVARSIGEQEQVPRGRVLLEFVLHPAKEAVEAFSHVNRLQGDEHSGGGRDA